MRYLSFSWCVCGIVKVEGQVIFGVPYEVTAEFLDRLIREYHIDYIVHGDDACYSANGQDAYYAVKKAGNMIGF